MTDISRDTEQELARLADGSLAGEDSERVRTRVEGSRELQVALAEQQRTVELLAAVDVQAPASLHREVEAMFAPAHVRHARVASRLGIASRRLGIVAALAAVIALVAVIVGSSLGGSNGLTVQQAAALTLRPATMAAPSESKAHQTQLSVAVGGISFPYWRELSLIHI